MARIALDSPAALGHAPLGRLLWHTCSQTTLSVGVYGIYALSNAWFVARGVGATALAAVNLVTPLLMLLGAVSTTVGVGGASLVARSLGAGRPADAARATGNAMTIFWTAAALTTVCGLLGLEPLLSLIGAQGEVREYARPYAAIILAGAGLSTGFSAIVRAEGRLRFSTMLWVLPVLTQLLLDPLLIYGFGLGIAGAALGTVGGQAVSAGMSVWFFFVQRNRPYRIGAAQLRPRAGVIGAIGTIGAPSFLAGLGATLLAVVVNASLAAAAGGLALAAYAVCARIQTFVTMPQLGITQGIQPVVGYNFGSGNLTRTRRTSRLGLAATLGYGLLAAVVLCVFADPLIGLFVSDPDVVGQAVVALRILAIGMAAAGVAPLLAGYFQAIGRATPSYLISIGTVVVVKLPLVLVAATQSTTAMWIALSVGECLSALAAFALVRRPAWSA